MENVIQEIINNIHWNVVFSIQSNEIRITCTTRGIQLIEIDTLSQVSSI